MSSLSWVQMEFLTCFQRLRQSTGEFFLAKIGCFSYLLISSKQVRLRCPVLSCSLPGYSLLPSIHWKPWCRSSAHRYVVGICWYTGSRQSHLSVTCISSSFYSVRSSITLQNQASKRVLYFGWQNDAVPESSGRMFDCYIARMQVQDSSCWLDVSWQLYLSLVSSI